MPTPSLRSATRGVAALTLFAALAVPAAAAPPEGRVRHSMTVSVEPQSHLLTVTDKVTFPWRPADGVVDFVLNAALKVSGSAPAVVEIPLGAASTFFGINGLGDATARQIGLKGYRARLAPGQVTLSIWYSGVVNFGLSDQKEEYTRGFRESAGVLGPQGVYLTGASYWYPAFNHDSHRVRPRGDAAARLARDLTGQRHVARGPRRRAVGVGRADGPNRPGRRPAPGLARNGRFGRNAGLPARA